MKLSTKTENHGAPKWRWLRFRVRTLLLVSGLCGAVVTPLAVKVHRYRAQREVIATIVEQRGKVTYADGSKGLPTDWWPFIFGEGLFARVRRVDLAYRRWSDLRPLAGMTQLEYLGLSATEVSDLRPLSGMKKLEALHVNGTKVADVGPLTGMSRLKWLSLDQTRVTDVSPLATTRSLEGLSLNHTGVTDLSPLVDLPKLRLLLLDGIKTTGPIPAAGRSK